MLTTLSHNKSIVSIAVTFICILLTCSISSCCATDTTVPAWKAADDEDTRQAREWLVGTWRGQTELDNGRKRVWLAQHFDDGKLKITFRNYSGDHFTDSVEVGLWGVEGEIYFTITHGWLRGEEFIPADPTDHVYYDVYEILRLDNSIVEYVHRQTGTWFQLMKVDDSYRLPDT